MRDAAAGLKRIPKSVVYFFRMRGKIAGNLVGRREKIVLENGGRARGFDGECERG